MVFFSTQGKAENISLDQFITFLNEKQRDPRLNEILYPLYDEKRAIEIINDYEPSDEVKNESKLLSVLIHIYSKYSLHFKYLLL